MADHHSDNFVSAPDGSGEENAPGVKRTAPDPWMEAMHRGDFGTAWAISDAVLAKRRRRALPCWHLPRHLQYLWTGAPLIHRHVLVRCYHGLGDTLQFCRYLPQLTAAAALALGAMLALWPLLSAARPDEISNGLGP